MKYLVLLALFACSSAPEQKPVKPVREEQPVVIPYRPGCVCTKIYLPVCAAGRTFGNECEAKCQGHTTWTEGDCSK